MPRKDASAHTLAPGKFRKSLARRTVIQVLLLSLIPVILVSGVTFWLTERLITDQLQQQFQTISQNFTTQLTDFATSRQKTIDSISKNQNFIDSVNVLISDTANQNEMGLARSQILSTISNLNFSPGTEASFDQVILIKPDGTIILSTNPEWTGQNLGSSPSIRRMLGNNGITIAHDISPIYPNRTVLLTSKLIVRNDVAQIVNLIGFSPSSLPSSLLAGINSYFQTGQAFFYTGDETLITYDKFLKQITEVETNPDDITAIETFIAPTAIEVITNTESITGQRVVNYSKYFSALDTHLILQVPQQIYLNQLRPMLQLIGLVLGIALLVLGTIVYFGTRRLVRPLVNLATISQAFAKGDWSQRAPVTRADEIGLLSNSFNQMVEQLTDLYRSLELKVEERTQQLRTASEVAQVATSTSEREEMAQRTAQLITERFGYHYAAIFLVDDTRSYATIRGVSEKSGQTGGLINHRVIINSRPQMESVVGNNTPTVINEFDRESMLIEDILLMVDTQSQALIPIAVNDQVLGFIDVQSRESNAFDPDTVNVFQTLANQIATGLRNIILLESAQVNLEETNLVYRASRQITQSKAEQETFAIVEDTLGQTDYVSMVLDVKPDQFTVQAFKDKNGSRMDANVKGVNLTSQHGYDYLVEHHLWVTDNLLAPSEFSSLTNFLMRRDCKSAAIIPILVDNRPIKAIALGSRESTSLSSATIQPFISLAEVVGNTLNRYQVMNTLEIRLNELEMLAAISEAISSGSELQELYRIIQQQFTNRLGSDLGFLIVLYDDENEMIHVPYAYEDGQEITDFPSFKFGEGLTSEIIRTREPLLISSEMDKASRQFKSKTYGKSALSWLGTPLIIGGKVIGAIVLQDNYKENRFDQNDLHLLNTASSPIANTIRNAQLLSQLQQNLSAYTQEHYLLNTLLDNIPEQIYIKDMEGKYLRVSKSYASRQGILIKDILNRTEKDLKGEEGLLTMLEEADILASSKSETGTLKKTNLADGSENWSLTSRIPLIDQDGNKYGLFGIIQDVTELKTTEQIAQTRAEQLRTAAAIARDTAGSLEMEELLKNAVNVIRDRYGFYHAGIFLLDAANEYAVLKEATGEAGAKMKEANHKLAVGSMSIVGRSTSTRAPVVSNDVRKEVSYFPNPMLPNTRSEVGIPLIAGDELLGILDVQSEKVNAFLEEDINILQTVADQLSIALMNARLYAQTQEHLAKHRLLHHITAAASASTDVDTALATTVQSLRAALSGDQISIYLVDDNEHLVMRASAGYEENEYVQTDIPMGEGIIGASAQERRPIRVNDIRSDPRYIAMDTRTSSELAVPILFNEQLLGILNIESAKMAAYDENDQEILATLGNNLASIIANAKLVEQVRIQVERQRQLYEITSRIRRSTDLRTILETSASEIGKLLRANQVKIQISPERDNGKSQEGEA